MKRKVIQLAGKTLVVSLPHKWAKKYGVKKGDEIEVEEEERRLVVKAQGEAKKAAKFIDLSDLDTMLHRTMSALYKAGYDEVEIKYDTPKQHAVIMNVINKSSVGFEVLRQGQKLLLVRNLSDLHSEEFDNLLRRFFLALLLSADDSLEYIKQGNNAGMEEIVLRDHLMNKYADLCRRMINTRGFDEIRKTTTYYFICEQLEKIGDGYKDLMKFMIKEKITKASKETQELMTNLNQFLRRVYELFYDFDLKKLEAFGIFSDKLRAQFTSLSETKSIKELRLNHYLFIIYSLIYDMNGALMTAKV